MFPEVEGVAKMDTALTLTRPLNMTFRKWLLLFHVPKDSEEPLCDFYASIAKVLAVSNMGKTSVSCEIINSLWAGIDPSPHEQLLAQAGPLAMPSRTFEGISPY